MRRRGRHSPTPLETIAVRVVDQGPCAHHLAGEDDVRALLARLPRGVTDGLAAVELRLGKETQAEHAASEPGGEKPDPFTGRLGWERFPGAWTGRILGRYRWETATIELYSAVFDPAHPRRPVWEPLLRAEALAVLAHEVAHHHDHACRQARGRWLAAPGDAAERYAEARQHEWTRRVVIPFLRERYGRDLARVERWIARSGGLALPFEELVDDPRATGRGGLTRLVFTMAEAVDRLLRDADARAPLWKRRLGFAQELHYQDRFDDSLRVIDGVLAGRPAEPSVLVQRADVLAHLERHAEALAVAGPLTAADPGFVEAWEVVLDACEGLERWADAAAAATRVMELAEAEGNRWRRIRALRDRARARLRSGDLAGARADVDRVIAEGGTLARMVAKLEAEIDAAEASG